MRSERAPKPMPEKGLTIPAQAQYSPAFHSGSPSSWTMVVTMKVPYTMKVTPKSM